MSKQKMQAKLNTKQALFVKYYIDCLNAKEAIVKAGYSKKHADKAAFQLMMKPQVKSAIEKNRAIIEKKTEVTFEWKVNKLKEIIDETEDKDIAIKSIEVLNKMQGHNAPDKQVNYNVDFVSEDLATARNKYLIYESHDYDAQD